jgi:class 3 adenylate cyclase
MLNDKTRFCIRGAHAPRRLCLGASPRQALSHHILFAARLLQLLIRLVGRNEMSAEVKKEIQLEIAHVLFTDIVGYSKLPINQQRALVERLNEIVRGTDEYQAAEKAGRLITIPTGDGITLVFYDSPETPAECALEISRALKKHCRIAFRKPKPRSRQCLLCRRNSGRDFDALIQDR